MCVYEVSDCLEDTGRKLNVHKAFNLRPVSTGWGINSCCSYLNLRCRPVLSKELFDIQTNPECKSTLKRVCDMIWRHS